MSVAYSHACPVVAEAVKEVNRRYQAEVQAIRQTYDQKLEQLEAEMTELKRLVADLLAVHKN
jgi:F0F1-type ATP synthase membrane subunit b/b'